ncbi:MAG: hypothetical protein NTV79_01530 [Candidatus Aureabacteria bacterium]|nr:hypothetical protein [Candidatus Auribacterota bacterium]
MDMLDPIEREAEKKYGRMGIYFWGTIGSIILGAVAVFIQKRLGIRKEYLILAFGLIVAGVGHLYLKKKANDEKNKSKWKPQQSESLRKRFEGFCGLSGRTGWGDCPLEAGQERSGGNKRACFGLQGKANGKVSFSPCPQTTIAALFPARDFIDSPPAPVEPCKIRWMACVLLSTLAAMTAPCSVNA